MTSATDGFDVNLLLHPAQSYRDPKDVLNDARLDANAKRAVLASWLSDVCAIAAAPGLEPEYASHVTFDDVMDALHSLDGEAAGAADYGRLAARARRVRDLYDGRNGNGGIFTS
jgi:hypothetical protein